MDYNIKPHPPRYAGVLFRSRLEASYAAFFDLARWTWEYEPIDLNGWTPDFRVEFPCKHSECEQTDGQRDGSHVLLCEVKPYFKIENFAGHPCMQYPYGQNEKAGTSIPADSGAALGVNPRISIFEMCHGAGGGQFSLVDWISPIDALWIGAQEKTRYRPPQERP